MWRGSRNQPERVPEGQSSVWAIATTKKKKKKSISHKASNKYSCGQ